jgi:membrane-bound metal-dependent hydrolase YbcI (DUF457 family)
MASPVFHGLAGAGLTYALAGDAHLPLPASLRKAAPLLFAGAILACLPDVDYLPGLLRGSLNTAHQGISHSLLWVCWVAVGIWMLGRAIRPAWFGGRTALFLLIVMGSHLLIDLCTEDLLATYGIPLWAPFSWTVVHSPVKGFLSWDKSSLSDLLHIRNLIPLSLELGTGSLFAVGCVAIKRGWTRRKAAV